MKVQEIVQQLSPTVRRYVYFGFALLSLALGAIQVGFATADVGIPLWVAVTVSVSSFVGAQVGFTAGTNVNAQQVEVDDRSEASAESPDYAI